MGPFSCGSPQHCLIQPTVIRMLTCSLCNYPRGLWFILLVWLLISELCSGFLAFEAVFLRGFYWLIWVHHCVIVVSDCGLSTCASPVDLTVLVIVPLHREEFALNLVCCFLHSSLVFRAHTTLLSFRKLRLLSPIFSSLLTMLPKLTSNTRPPALASQGEDRVY